MRDLDCSWKCDGALADPRLGHRDLVDPDGARGVAEVGLGADGQQSAEHLVGGPLHGRDRGDPEPLVDLGPPGVVDPGDDVARSRTSRGRHARR